MVRVTDKTTVKLLESTWRLDREERLLGTGETLRYRIAETEIQGRKANYIRRNREYMKRRRVL